jgi:hypothetical protein
MLVMGDRSMTVPERKKKKKRIRWAEDDEYNASDALPRGWGTGCFVAKIQNRKESPARKWG